MPKNEKDEGKVINLSSEQKSYRRGVKNFLLSSDDPLKKIKSVLGPKGKLSEELLNSKGYNDIEVPIPAGMDENMLTAIMLGAMMKPERMGYLKSWATKDKDVVASNQKAIVTRIVIGDNSVNKDGRFVEKLIDAKKEVIAALEEFKNGNVQHVRELADVFIDYSLLNNIEAKTIVKDGINTHILNSGEPALLLANEVIGRPPVQATGTCEEPHKLRNKAYTIMINELKTAQNNKELYLHNYKTLEENEKEELAADILFGEYLAAMHDIDAANIKEESKKFIQKIMNDMGIHIDDKIDNGFDECVEEIENGPLGNDIRKNIISNTISDIHAILSEPDGLKKLRDVFIPEIKKTTAYKRIITATDQEELWDAFMEGSTAARKGLTSLKKIDTSPKTAEINDKYRNIFSGTVKNRLNKEVKDSVANHYSTREPEFENPFKDYIIESGQPFYTENAVIANRMLEDLKANNKWGGSKNNNYNNVLEALRRLEQMSKELILPEDERPKTAALHAYVKQLEKVDRLAEKYLAEKTNINSSYAERRVAGIKKLRGCLMQSLTQIKEEEETALYTEVDEIGARKFLDLNERGDQIRKDELNLTSSRYRNIFLNKDIGNGFNIGRSSEHSIALMALAATGKYTMDELMDSDKFWAEKQAMCDQVIHRCLNSNDENKKWIVKNIYEGSQILYGMIDEKMKKLDLEDPEIFRNEEMIKIQQMEYMLHDAWQEYGQCKEQVAELIRDKNLAVKDYRAFTENEASRQGIANVMDEKSRSLADNIKNYLKGEKNAIRGVIMAAYQYHTVRDTFLERMSEKKDYSRSFDSDVTTKALLIGDNILQPLRNSFEYIEKNPKLMKRIFSRIVDGTLFENIKCNYVPGKIPTYEGIDKFESQLADESFLIEADEAKERLKSKSAQYYSKHIEEYIRDAAYVEIGELFKTKHKHYRNVDTDELLTLKESAELLSTDQGFIQSLKSKKSGKFYNPSVLAKGLSGQKYIDSISRSLKENKPKIKNNENVDPEALDKAELKMKSGEKVIQKSMGGNKK